MGMLYPLLQLVSGYFPSHLKASSWLRLFRVVVVLHSVLRMVAAFLNGLAPSHLEFSGAVGFLVAPHSSRGPRQRNTAAWGKPGLEFRQVKPRILAVRQASKTSGREAGKARECGRCRASFGNVDRSSLPQAGVTSFALLIRTAAGGTIAPLSGRVLLLLALAAEVGPRHGFQPRFRNRLLADRAYAIRAASHSSECLVDRS